MRTLYVRCMLDKRPSNRRGRGFDLFMAHQHGVDESEIELLQLQGPRGCKNAWIEFEIAVQRFQLRELLCDEQQEGYRRHWQIIRVIRICLQVSQLDDVLPERTEQHRQQVAFGGTLNPPSTWRHLRRDVEPLLGDTCQEREIRLLKELEN